VARTKIYPTGTRIPISPKVIKSHYDLLRENLPLWGCREFNQWLEMTIEKELTAKGLLPVKNAPMNP
jgi:hypothetical protein